MEAFSNVFQRATNLGLVSGLKLPNYGPCISHLLYADDAIILGSWSHTHIANISRILRCFHLASGLKVNLHKLSFYGINLPPNAIAASIDILNCQIGHFPVTYLGLVVGSNMNLKKHWTPVIQIFENRLSQWKASTLSLGDKITLISFVLDSLPSYYFLLYKAPVCILSKLESIRKSFFGEVLLTGERSRGSLGIELSLQLNQTGLGW
uniref:uncharacterized protein LOC122596983 n=1 Tax=Erigeron canadensis TaxID=72917 RepID=UPI001CB960CD|nr:uncharacterized protein LOC122596983 [Erigeron canadensis]